MNYVLVVVFLFVGIILYWFYSIMSNYGIALITDPSNIKIHAHGWDAFWPYLTTGFALGIFLTVIMWALFYNSFKVQQKERQDALFSEEKSALEQASKTLEKRLANIEQEIQEKTIEGLKSYEFMIDMYKAEWEKSNIEIEKLKLENDYLMRNNDKISGLLKGAQQKAARIKKAQLTSVKDAKLD